MPRIYAYSSNSIYCDYDITIKRSGSNIQVTAAGTIYGNGSSADSNNNLYAHVRYNVTPDNFSSTANRETTYVSSYGKAIDGSGSSGKLIVSAPLNSSSIPTTGKAFSKTWTISSNEAKTYNNVALFLSKSASSPSEVGNNAYAFIGKKSGSLTVNNPRYHTYSSLSVGAGYTKCTAPTTITVSDSIKKPNEYVRVSWGGAKPGTNNAINGYRIYYNVGSAPTTSSNSSTVSKTAEYCDIKLTAARGSTYYFKVMTIGSASGYSSDLSSASATCKVNSLPTAPTLSKSNITLTEDNSDSLTISASTDNDGQSLKYYYYTNLSSTEQALSLGNFTISNTGNDLTYYFVAYDGLEYSATSSCKVNIEPSISLEIEESGEEYIFNNTTSYYKKIKLTGTTNKNGTLNYIIEDETIAIQQITKGTYEYELDLTSITSVKLENNKTYTLKAKFETVEASGEITTPPASDILFTTNELNQNTYENLKTYFYNTLIINYKQDTGALIDIKGIYKTTDTELQSSLGIPTITDSDNGQLTLDCSSLTNLESGGSYYIAININNGFGEIVRKTGNFVYKPTQNLIVTPDEGFSPFTQIDDNFEVYATPRTEYYIDTEIILSYNNETKNITNFSERSFGEMYIYSIKPADLFTLAGNELTFDNYDNDYDVNITIKYNSPFGYFTSASSKTQFKFVETITNENFTDFSITRDNSQIGNTSQIFEGDELEFSITSKLYNANTLTFIPQIQRGTGSWTDLLVNDDNRHEVNAGTRTGVATKTIELTYKVPQINTSIQNSFRIKVLDQNNTEYIINYLDENKELIEINSVRHVTPIFTIDKFVLDGTEFKYSYEVNDWGTDIDENNDIVTKTLIINYSSDNITFEELTKLTDPADSNTDQSITVPDEDEEWHLYYIDFILTTTIGNIEKSSTKSTVVYNRQPTISYRPNHLGINYQIKDSDTDVNDAIIVIGETSGRNKIIYRGSGDACTLDGFQITVIDGGTW